MEIQKENKLFNLTSLILSHYNENKDVSIFFQNINFLENCSKKISKGIHSEYIIDNIIRYLPLDAYKPYLYAEMLQEVPPEVILREYKNFIYKALYLQNIDFLEHFKLLCEKKLESEVSFSKIIQEKYITPIINFLIFPNVKYNINTDFKNFFYNLIPFINVVNKLNNSQIEYNENNYFQLIFSNNNQTIKQKQYYNKSLIQHIKTKSIFANELFHFFQQDDIFIKNKKTEIFNTAVYFNSQFLINHFEDIKPNNLTQVINHLLFNKKHTIIDPQEISQSFKFLMPLLNIQELYYLHLIDYNWNDLLLKDDNKKEITSFIMSEDIKQLFADNFELDISDSEHNNIALNNLKSITNYNIDMSLLNLAINKAYNCLIQETNQKDYNDNINLNEALKNFKQWSDNLYLNMTLEHKENNKKIKI